MLFAVAHHSLFDGTLKMTVILAPSIAEAIKEGVLALTVESDRNGDTARWLDSLSDDVESIKQAFLDCDQTVEAIQIA